MDWTNSMMPHHLAKPVSTKIMIPGSKSMTHRVLLLASLCDGISEIEGILVNEDILTFAKALHELGIMIQLDKKTHSCIVGGNDGQFPRKKAFVHCREAGTVARFLMVACAATPGRYEFDASPSLAKQSMKSLIQALTTLGATVLPDNQFNLPLTILGMEGFKGGEIEIDAEQNAQFVSALLMIAPFAKSNILINAKNILSEPYIHMTCDMMGDFGVLVRRMHQSSFQVPVPQRYHARFYQVEPDLLIAAYFFAAAAMTGIQISIQPINITETKQADVEFLTILKKMGCVIISDEQGLHVQGPLALQGVNADMRNCSDTFMVLSIIAAFAVTPTTMTNIQSNRISVMRQALEKCEIKVEEGKDWLKIFPSQPRGAIIDVAQDYKMAMAFTLLGLKVTGMQIEENDCIEKICPGFFELWERVT